MLEPMRRGRSEPLRDRATAPIVERIKKRHQDAGDAALEMFPAPEDVYGVLLYAQQNAGVLEAPVERLEAVHDRTGREEERLQTARDALQENALDRLRLLRRLRQLTDIEEIAVLEACGRSGLKARELGVVLGIKSRWGPAQRLERLRLAVQTRWEFRTPRLAREAEAAEAAAHQKVASGHARVRAAAKRLLAHRQDFLAVEDLDEWWDDLEWQLDGNDLTASEQASSAAQVRCIVREIRDAARDGGVPASLVKGAMHALADAEEAAKRD
ncbi:hypothetical protein [Streptomyces goshikiensis]|uniref:hypothetical protein n=1 Tax=Streptomyces goshikiensis TaxID=1942 RepID=UPI0036D006DF